MSRDVVPFKTQHDMDAEIQRFENTAGTRAFREDLRRALNARIVETARVLFASASHVSSEPPTPREQAFADEAVQTLRDGITTEGTSLTVDQCIALVGIIEAGRRFAQPSTAGPLSRQLITDDDVRHALYASGWDNPLVVTRIIQRNELEAQNVRAALESFVKRHAAPSDAAPSLTEFVV